MKLWARSILLMVVFGAMVGGGADLVDAASYRSRPPFRETLQLQLSGANAP